MKTLLSAVCVLLASACLELAPVDVGAATCDSDQPCASGTVCYRGYCMALPTACNRDGIIDLGEDCDDGNDVASDGCTNTCEVARCGDGIVRTDLQPHAAAYEDCEPSAEPQVDYCMTTCRLGDRPRRLAVTRRMSCLLRAGAVHCWSGAHLQSPAFTALPLPTPAPAASIYGRVDLPTDDQYGSYDLYQRDASGLMMRHWLHAQEGSPVLGPRSVNEVPHQARAVDLGLQACGVTPAGQVICSGRNNCGQAIPWRPGGAPEPGHPQPGAYAVPAVTSVRAIAVAATSTCAVHVDGTVRCWGGTRTWDGADCELNDPRPRLIDGLAGVVAISATETGFAALTRDREVLTWGRDWRGQVPDAPQRRTLSQDALQIASARETHCLRYADGDVACWGQHRGLPGGPSDDLSDVDLLSDVVELSDSDTADHVCALRTDESVWCWGENRLGQLGDGTTQDRAEPVQVQGL